MEYWDRRYARGGNSGDGSIGRYRKWKWGIIHRYAPDLTNVVDIGCGDLRFWGDVIPKQYVGVDISEIVITKNTLRHPRNNFITSPAEITIPGIQAPTVLCLDLLFHIMDDTAYTQILGNLCRYSTDLIFIFTWQKSPWKDRTTDNRYQIFRPLEDQLSLFKENGFTLTGRSACPDDPGAMYVFKKSTICEKGDTEDPQ